MASKKTVSSKMTYEPRVLPPKFVAKAKMFCVTTFDRDGKQKIEWELTKELADKKYIDIKTKLVNA